jgi:DNA polymerase I-like protein with 3'-5' exonuclease and polymerase domains
MKIPVCNVIDAETEAIRGRPLYPPKPVGWAVQLAGSRKRKYWSAAHPDRNNCTWGQMEGALKEAWGNGQPFLCQNGKFDLDVAEAHHGLPMPNWKSVHDTLYLLFLHDPHSRSLSLKPAAEAILGWPPEEQDAVRQWLTDCKIVREKDKGWGAHICDAPGDLVGKYAVGDLARTEELFAKLYPEIVERGMLAAYDRERRLMPIFLEAERTGIRCDLRALERDVKVFRAARERAADWIRKRLKRPGLNLDADADVGDALDATGMFTEWAWTKGGKNKAPQRSIAKKNMPLSGFADQKFAMAYGYHARCGTLLSFFLEPWLELASANGGYLKPNWNQVRQSHGADGVVGTRSGRLSCDTPNFLAVVKKWENNKGDGYAHPAHIPDLPELALARKYLLPDKDGVWLHRDYNQQELRLLAHFADGQLLERYRERPYRNPDGAMRFDIHSTMQAGILERSGLRLNRDSMKFVDFGALYGTGITGMALGLNTDRRTAEQILAAKAALMPEVDHPVTGLVARIKQRFREGGAIRTWGGREYYCEKPSYSDKYGRIMTYEYKGLSYLIQPSAADMTKEAMLAYQTHSKREGRFATQVYDELNISTPSLKGLSAKGKKDCVAREMHVLREAMELQPCDAPMLSDGKIGSNWAELKTYWTKEEAEEII